MDAIKQPVPWVVTAQRARAVVLIERICPEIVAEAIKFAAKGAVRSRGYAGKTQVGVIICMGKTLIFACQR
jgi:hypothetical protein